MPGRPQPCTARASWAAAPTAAWLRSVETTRRFPDCAQTRSGRTRGKSGSVCDQLSSSEEQRNIFGSPVLNEKPARTKKTKFSKKLLQIFETKKQNFSRNGGETSEDKKIIFSDVSEEGGALSRIPEFPTDRLENDFCDKSLPIWSFFSIQRRRRLPRVLSLSHDQRWHCYSDGKHQQQHCHKQTELAARSHVQGLSNIQCLSVRQQQQQFQKLFFQHFFAG